MLSIPISNKANKYTTNNDTNDTCLQETLALLSDVLSPLLSDVVPGFVSRPLLQLLAVYLGQLQCPLAWLVPLKGFTVEDKKSKGNRMTIETQKETCVAFAWFHSKCVAILFCVVALLENTGSRSMGGL